MLVTQQPGSMASEILSQADNWFCFHLLSEGDAGTLGKYNSHYSEDVLAHLIGEPIPGNCYMWSAPLQPFVLPVRVRSFEGLYRHNVNSDTTAQPVSNIRAQGLVKHLSEALDRLSGALIQRLKESHVKFCAIPQQMLPNGGQPIGIKSGQLYYLIRDIKTASDTQSEEQLKRPLLTHLLGEGRVHLMKHADTEYYCADAQDWNRALGYSPKLTPI